MSQEQPLQSRAVADRQQIRIRFDQLKRSSGLRVIGIPELIGLSVAALLALLTIFAYLYFLAPAHSRRDLAQLERDRLQGQVRASQLNLNEDIGVRATVDKINASLSDFEGNWLAAPGSGRLSLYAELNELIRSNGLRNTSGPSYTTLGHQRERDRRGPLSERPPLRARHRDESPVSDHQCRRARRRDAIRCRNTGNIDREDADSSSRQQNGSAAWCCAACGRARHARQSAARFGYVL